MESIPNTLVCMRVDAPLIHPESLGGYHCSDCKAEVTVAPSGRALLALRPHVAVICLECCMVAIFAKKAVMRDDLHPLREMRNRELKAAPIENRRGGLAGKRQKQ